MRIVLILLCVISTPVVCGFTDSLYDRLVLGSDVLSDVRRVCQTSKDPQDYDALYPRVLSLPVPLLIRAYDRIYRIFEPSKEAKLAIMWRDTGEFIHSLLKSVIFYTPHAAEVWDKPQAQGMLVGLASKQDVDAFNRYMDQLMGIHQKVDEKMKVPGFWYKYQIFKNSESELRDLLAKSLNILVEVRLIVNRMSLNSSTATWTFKLFIPYLIRAIEGMGKIYRSLDFIDVSEVQKWYSQLRINCLSAAIKRCFPPLIPLSKSY